MAATQAATGPRAARQTTVELLSGFSGDAGADTHAADFFQFGAQAVPQGALRTQLIEQVLGLHQGVTGHIALK